MTTHRPGIAESPPRCRRSAPGDRGSVSAELVVFVVPVMLLLTMFVVFCGRSASAAIDVRSAAAAAARAAADAATPAGAVAAAASAVAATSAGTAWTCTPSVDTGQLRAGGQVSVSVDCRVPLSDLGLPGLTAARVVHASATEPIDTYRARP
jgi:Flp pilus assembly protein TadG